MTEEKKDLYDSQQLPEVTDQAANVDLSEKYLSDAFKKAFLILKVIMLIVVLWMLASGVFKVEQDEEALILEFGKIKGVGADRIRKPGLHFAWPEPIDEVVRLPVKKIHTLAIDSFWYFQTEKEKLTKSEGRFGPTLDPKNDGYCLTRNEKVAGVEGIDYNIIHSKWQMTYRIDQTEHFFSNIYYETLKPGESFDDALKSSVTPLLSSLAEDAITTTMVEYSIDEAIVSAPDIANNVQLLLQDKLDEIQSGITVVGMQVDEITWPRQVADAFQELNKASQEKQKLITDAQSYSSKLLSEAGGPKAEEILIQLKKPDISDGETERLLSSLSGTAQQTISEAKAYRTKIVESAKANADYLEKLLPEYQKRPKLVLQQIYREAVGDVLDNVDEKMFIQPGKTEGGRELRLLINRDPEIRKKKPNE